MISLIPLSIFILGIVMIFDHDATFTQVFKGLFLVFVAIILFAGIGLYQIIPHDQDCKTAVIKISRLGF